MGIYLYSVLDYRLDEEHTVFLADDIELIREALTAVKSYQEFLNASIAPQPLFMTGSRLHIGIYDEQGQLLKGYSALDVPPPTTHSATSGQRALKTVTWASPEGRYYRAISAWAEVGTQNPHKVLIKIAIDVSIEHRLLSSYHNTLLATLLIGMICAATFGYVVSREGLLPVRRIAQAAGEITSEHLERRLDIANVPDELHELVEAFNSMLDRLNASFLRLTQFSSDLAHELRTPINNLMGEAQVALSRIRSAEDYHEVLESSVEEFERLSRMIESMLFLARGDESKVGLKASRLDAREELEKIAEFYQVLADEDGMNIRCDGTARLDADPILFRRAVGNLLSNALRHSPAGAEIVMQAHEDESEAAIITVTNPGEGIPAEFQEKIFDRFFRVEPSRDKTTEGAGLGLPIVKTIMNLHGGAVTVQSTPGGSTAFTIRFPNRSGKAAV